MNDDKTGMPANEKRKPADHPASADTLSKRQMKDILHELRVHEIELEMQNDELRRTQENLEAARARYFDLYEMAPVGYITLSVEGLILESNLTAADLLGLTRGEMAGQPVLHFIMNDDRDIFYLHSKDLFESKERRKCELRMVKKDKSLLWVQVDSSPAQDEKGVPVYRVVLSDITDRKCSEEQVRTLLEEKKLLLKEVHHRIKNNMNTISGLLMLQASSAGDPAAVSALNDAQCRVRSMMILYDRLYRSEDYRKIQVKEYLEKFIDEIFSIFENSGNVKIEKDIDDFILDTKVLFPLGIIINELITNAFKYAFPGGRKGSIQVSVRKTDNRIFISVKDDGAGFQGKIESMKTGGFGLNLVSALTEQFGVELKITKDNGTEVEIIFKTDI